MQGVLLVIAYFGYVTFMFFNDKMMAAMSRCTGENEYKKEEEEEEKKEEEEEEGMRRVWWCGVAGQRQQGLRTCATSAETTV